MANSTDIAKVVGVKPAEVQAVFESVVRYVAAGETVRIKGFGKFDVKVHKGRTISTPKVNDGKPFAYADTKLLRFKAAPDTKEVLKGASTKDPKQAGDVEKASGKVKEKQAKIRASSAPSKLKKNGKPAVAPEGEEAAEKPKKAKKAGVKAKPVAED